MTIQESTATPTSPALDRPVAESIAVWAHALAFSDIPKEVIEASKLHILDTLGIGIAGGADEVGLITRRWLPHAGSGSASILSDPRKVSAVDAAFVNGLVTHALDFDGGTFGGHPGPCIVPAILAAAEGRGLTGQQILCAYTAAMEVFGRFGLCTDYERIHLNGFHPTAVFGMIGATVGAGLVLGLDETQLANAIALAASSGAGVTANFGSMGKPLHAGNVASSAVRVAQLAAAGMYGTQRALESPEGFQTAYMRDEIDWASFVANLGKPLRMSFAPPSIKQYPTCGCNQRAIENVVTLMAENDVAPERIEELTITVNPEIFNILRFDWPENQYEAKFSLKYNIAVTAIHGRPTIESFREPLVSDPKIRDLGSRIRVDATGVGNRSFTPVQMRLTDGQVIETANSDLPGSPRAPLGEQAVVRKFLSCCDRVVGSEVADAACTGVLELDSSADHFWDVWENLGGQISRTTG